MNTASVLRTMTPTSRRGLRSVAALALLCAPLLLVAFRTAAATDTPPNRLSFQSYLTDDSNNPVGSGSPVNKKMIFRLYDASTGGNLEWAEEQIVTVNNGTFSVILGEGSAVGGANHDLDTAFTGADASDRYIEVFVSDTNDANPQTLTPRLRVLPSAYAYLATFAKTAESLTTPTSNLADAAVTTVKIADNGVTSAKIADGAVATADIANTAVTTAKLADSSVTSAKIANGTIATADISNAAVTTAKLDDSSVTSAKIADATVATADLANNAVTLAKIQTKLFLMRSYNLNLTGQSGSLEIRDISPVNYYPLMQGFSFGNVDVNETGDNPAWRINWTAVGSGAGSYWTLGVGGPTHSGNHIDLNVRVMWIPRALIDDTAVYSLVSPNP